MIVDLCTNPSIFGWFLFTSLYIEKLNYKDPNLDVSSLPLLKCICAHPNLDVSSLPLLE